MVREDTCTREVYNQGFGHDDVQCGMDRWEELMFRVLLKIQSEIVFFCVLINKLSRFLLGKITSRKNNSYLMLLYVKNTLQPFKAKCFFSMF